MKLSLQCPILGGVLAAACIFWPFPVSAVLLDFSTFSLESGTDLQVGAVYRYTGVALGVEALISIDELNNGATIFRIDDATAPPPTSGSFQAFQPVLSVTASLDSNAVFTITFVDAGTSNPTSISDFDLAAVDIDGDNVSGTEFEYVYLQGYDTYTVENATQVAVTGEVWTPVSMAKFSSAVPLDFPGVDITNTNHIAETAYTDTSSLTVTMGLEGTRATPRLRIYSLNPFDTVTFTDPVTVPEPTGAMLLFFSMSLCWVRRRRAAGT